MNNSRELNNAGSIFLDCLRILAALTVFVYHGYLEWFSNSALLNVLSDCAHVAVIIFFALSGYVIAYTSSAKNNGIIEYFRTRLTRLYSIMLPSLIITAICELAVRYYNYNAGIEYYRTHTIVRYILSGLFLNEIWFFSSAPHFNGPLWSLSYEFWYYMIFGFWYYKKQKKSTSFAFTLLACCIAGPKILLLLPCWLIGYFAYKLPKPVMHVLPTVIFIFLAFTAATGIVLNFNYLPYNIGHPPFIFSNQFLSDWMVSLFVGVALWLIPLYSSKENYSRLLLSVRNLGNLTFPLYVLHTPFFILWKGVFGFRKNDSQQLYTAMVEVFIIVVLVSIFLDRQRPKWTTFSKWIVNIKLADRSQKPLKIINRP